ncbi:GTP-binding protein [Keratinibaculum paraultunense]|uniref:Probable GTP-binding protein EngB n=1 Tax=Keratinibaculum paraultunense TaxID=1278232 RepID=A0A4R3KW17_9FIRM|nr:ribosome biogenesis GTP-binding protein YihA/YsxC [Keratinibaculum paraultunense]QQY79317.1 YihA family ribosome biogenesis GTP-binding protein [Keratinibaculum paraultunense]TCS89452.1 GTP-binding protein [Keratinibaculum paraultunense]
MKIRKAQLEKIAVNKKQYPSPHLPEIAFAGRSNVGKSSFINSMVNRKDLARISGKPGKTRTINFYNINDQFRFVDLPGYGYAKVSKAEKEKWGPIIEEYLSNRENLIEVILLVDMRHEPTELDLMMYNWIKFFGYSGLVIATKADKISKGKYQSNINMIKNKLNIEDPELIIPYSSAKNINKDLVWKILEDKLLIK